MPGPAEPAHEVADRTMRVLSPSECHARLETRIVGRVVFVDVRGPVALPVNYVLDHEDIVFRTEAWSSILATTSAGHVGFEVDDIDEHERVGWSVLASGAVARVEDPSDLQHVTWLGPTPWARGIHGPRDRYLRLSVTQLTGREVVRGDEPGVP